MSESVLKALMQLFAIVADVQGLNDKSKATVKQFLAEEVGSKQVEKYLELYDSFIQKHHYRKTKKDGRVKQTSRNAVKILRIAKEINQTLTRQQKLIVVIRVMEYIYGQDNISEQNLEFLQAIVDSFNIDLQEFELLTQLLQAKNEVKNPSESIVVLGSENQKEKRQFEHSGLSIPLVFVHLSHSKVLVVRPLGKQELYLGGSGLKEGKIYLFNPGASIRSSRISPIYFSDILSHFTHSSVEVPVLFSAQNIEYRFNKKEIGLRPLNFEATSGKMVGIMGGSGTGKSTLLNVLNGNYTPSSGSVSLNGKSIHHQKEDIEGLIGYVPQDDLLIEDLTVFQNLYYAAKLSFGNTNEEDVSQRVEDTLRALGLEDTHDLKVGSSLEKTISGGQRKRLNIALELMREPAVLFVDEPTSGLSSRDSENIMDLLKELALKGKLIFVVIHQPSSDIFKMFDQLLILDKGGYLIYQGNPLDSIAYFKNASGIASNEAGDCPTCGNVNPEQIFDVIEARVLNEYGDVTDERKRSPEEWQKRYEKEFASSKQPSNSPKDVPKADYSIPGLFKQFQIFTIRDVLSKLSNQQYMIINLLEAPVLALIIAGFLRYRPHNSGEYVFRENENILAYIFISVVVALFLGLSVSAEEIIRDRKIRKREAFLNLSKGAYLLSKIAIQFGISAIQIFSYVAIGNYILGIEGMTFNYWAVLFSAACFANVTGLNISASFKKVVTIYILIPFIIIPQILFSGVLVKYDDLNPWFASKRGVPLIGNIMTSRWAFEALAVEQVTNNLFERYYFDVNCKLYHFSFMKNYWVPEIKASLSALENGFRKGEPEEKLNSEKSLVYWELQELPKKELVHFKGNWQNWKNNSVDHGDLEELKAFIEIIDDYYNRMIRKYTQEKDLVTRTLYESLGGEKEYWEFKSTYENEQLVEFVNNKNSLTKIVEFENELVRNENVAYQYPSEGIHHYYTPVKQFMGKIYSTFWYNLAIIWGVTLTLMVVLYFDGLKRFLHISSKILSR